VVGCFNRSIASFLEKNSGAEKLTKLINNVLRSIAESLLVLFQLLQTSQASNKLECCFSEYRLVCADLVDLGFFSKEM